MTTVPETIRILGAPWQLMTDFDTMHHLHTNEDELFKRLDEQAY